MISYLFCVLVCVLASTIDVSEAKGACKPTTLIMTRASGSSAYVHDDGEYKPKFPLNGVDLANINGALKYVMTETIDIHTGVTNDTKKGECYRKNWINYIQFYQVEFCNPDNVLWWFNPSRPDGYGNQGAVDFNQFGSYLTFDNGQCHDSNDCDKLHGTNGKPALGPWVGFQDQSGDPRNPVDDAYWYSLPGDCPLSTWPSKTDKCSKKYQSMQCADGETPDGVKCVWNNKFIGQINLDHLSGITSLKNPSTRKNYTSFEEFCLAGGIEFERDPKNYSFVRGMDFYKDPLSEDANDKRIITLLKHYADKNLYPENEPIPEILGNPPCYEAVRSCGDGIVEDTRRCVRDDSQVCVYCELSKEPCPELPNDWESKRFPELKKVQLKTDEDNLREGDKSKEETDMSILNTPHKVFGMIIFIIIQIILLQ